MSEVRYPELFKPFKINNLEIKNRIIMAPMYPSGQFDNNHNINDPVVDYYEARAKGGLGMIITGAAEGGTQFSGFGPIHTPWNDPARLIRQYSKLINRVHAHGCKMFNQISFDFGRQMVPGTYPGTPIAPSVQRNRVDPNLMHREITYDEIQRMIEDVGNEAKVFKDLGYDGLDLVCYGSYLLDQFLTKAWNTRTDKYGGETVEERATIVKEMIQSIRSTCGAGFPLSVKITTKHHMKGNDQGGLKEEEYEEYGRDVSEGIELAKVIAGSGADAIYLANGSYDAMYWQYPPVYQDQGLWLDDFKGVREAVKEVADIPVIGGGRILEPDFAEKVLEDGIVDAVVIGRAMIADPEWTNKAKRGEPEAIRPCIGCNKGCINAYFLGTAMTCAVNPDACYERTEKYQPAKESKHVVVIGGGIAGTQCAIEAANRGHKVDLYEKNDKIGGALRAISIWDRKDADHRFLAWLERELKVKGVNVHLNTALTAEEAAAMNADEYVVAVGGTPKMVRIPGVDRENVLAPVYALQNPDKIGDKVVIIGGGEVGCEVAIWLKSQEKKSSVTIVELGKELMSGAAKPMIANEKMLNDMVKFYGVDVHLNSSCTEIGDGTVKMTGPEGEMEFEADTVIVALGFATNMSLYSELNSKTDKVVHLLGESWGTGSVLAAMRDGKAVAEAIE